MAVGATGAPAAKRDSGRVGARASNVEKVGLLSGARVESRPSRSYNKNQGRPRKGRTVVMPDGTEKLKELTKGGWARFTKKVIGFAHWLCSFVADGDWFGEALTIETLEDAVRTPDAEDVERLLNCGLDPNEPVDEAGHTVLDCLVVEQIQMLQDCQEQKQKGLGSDNITSIFIEHQDSFFQVMDILKDHGAVMSGDQRDHRFLHDIS